LTLDADVLVIGSGIAGLTFSLKTARHASILLITKKERAETSTNYARGGIAAVLGKDDDVALHVEDTLVAGAGLCHGHVVEMLVREGPDRVRELMDWGARFRHDGEALSLGREGGHSRRRILHAGDQTGQEIERALLEAVEAEPRIRVLEDHLAIDLLVEEDAAGRARCRGALALDHRLGRLVHVHARATMLATGGCGQVHRHTTNPPIATGDGVAMAYRAGARVANMEFIQFHPTALYPTEDPAFLISEALRGEGAVLRRLDGRAFMDEYHPLGSLAPRDVVARAIDRELRATGDSHVVLDVSAIPGETMESRFPGAVEGCRKRGVDLFGSGIPVVPAAHYLCGGVVTDTHGGTTLRGLYAAGEVACTGVHGANRLASNSLLEAVVFSHRAAVSVLERLSERAGAGEAAPEATEAEIERTLAHAAAARGSDVGLGPTKTEPRAPGTVVVGEGSPGSEQASHSSEPEATPGEGPGLHATPDARLRTLRRELRSLMWEHVGIVRSDALLEEAEHEVRSLETEWEGVWRSTPTTPEGVELRNLLDTAGLIVRCARLRLESRGLHYNVDHPWRNSELYLRDTIIEP
jgi:L-aspartate oxidase